MGYETYLQDNEIILCNGVWYYGNLILWNIIIIECYDL